MIDYKGILESTRASEVGIADGLVCWWPLDGNLRDYSGNRMHLTAAGSPTYESGIRGKSMKFDGIDDYLHNSGVPSLIEASSFTLSYWLKFTSALNIHTVTFNTSSGDDNILFGVYSGGHNMYTEPEGHKYTAPINDGEWHHVAVTFDMTSGTVNQYIDSSLALSSAIATSVSSTDRFSIGQEWDASTESQFFSGNMDDIRLYSRVLTEEEISIQYKWTKPDTGMQLGSDGRLYVSGRIKEV